MRGQGFAQAVERKKVVVIWALFAVSAAITLLGLAFCAISAFNHWKFLVLQATVPGEAFGVVIAFLGMRYFLSVMKLKSEVYKPDSRFSWGNFKKRRPVS